MQGLYLDQLFDLLTKPAGWFLAIWLLVAVIAATQVVAARWGLLAVAMFCASLGRDTRPDRVGTDLVPLISPLNEMQTLGRPITMALLVAGAVVVTATSAGRSHTPVGVRWMVGVQAVLLFKMLLSGMTTYAAFSVVTYALWWYVFVVGVGRWVRTPADFVWAVRCPCLASALFCAANLAQAAVNPAPLLMGFRFTGTTANPQFAAVLLGLTAPAAAYLAARRGLALAERAAWGLLLLVQAGMIVWTGSRTGALMGVVSVALVFRRQLGQLVFVGLVLGGAVAWIGAEFNDYLQVDYLVRTDDTRSEMWAGMWAGFVNYPVLGAPQDAAYGRLGFAENSWLAMACACGFIGLVPLLGFGLRLVGDVRRLGQLAVVRPRLARTADLLVASLIALLVGSVFEAYLLGVINFPLPFLYIVLVLIDHVRAAAGTPPRPLG